MTTGKKRTHFVLLLFLLAFLLAGCGKKGPLTLEPNILPLPIEQLRLAQVGKEIRLEWQFPGLLSDNKSKAQLDEIGKILVYYSGKQVPAEKFKNKAVLLNKRSMKDLIPREGGYSLSIPFKLKELDDKTHYFAVMYYYGKKKSPISQVVSLKTITPFKSITDLAIKQEQKTLVIKWGRPVEDEAGSKITGITGYNIYRRVIPQGSSTAPVATSSAIAAGEFIMLNQKPLLHEYYEDEDTGIDGEYFYYATTLRSKSSESEPSNVAALTITDIFPPDPPQNLVVFKHKSHMLLTWEKVKEKDLAYYIVYRQSADGENTGLIPIAKEVIENYYKDTAVSQNTVYFYSVTAVDRKGNESKQSNIVKERF